ncbi:MAG: FAD:protein FMN transferase [Magnetococcus sp. WYHC-3]
MIQAATCAILTLLLLAGCGAENIQRTTSRLALGTTVSVTTWTHTRDASAWDRQEAEAVKAAFVEIERIEAQMSRHRPASLVSRINAHPGQRHPISAELADLLQLSWRFQEFTGGTFDVSLLPLTRLWGFSDDPPPSAPPAAAAIQNWLRQRAPAPGWTLERTPDGRAFLTLDQPGHGLDLGGIAKGYAMDRAADTLLDRGVVNFLLNAGGSIRTEGAKGDTPWSIGVRHPRRDQGVAAAIKVSGSLSLATSGDYERAFIHQGQRYHHILDPTTGHPSRSGVVSVSIQASNGTLADGLSTGFFLLGVEKGKGLLEHFPGSSAFWVTESGTWGIHGDFIGEPRL